MGTHNFIKMSKYVEGLKELSHEKKMMSKLLTKKLSILGYKQLIKCGLTIDRLKELIGEGYQGVHWEMYLHPWIVTFQEIIRCEHSESSMKTVKNMVDICFNLKKEEENRVISSYLISGLPEEVSIVLNKREIENDFDMLEESELGTKLYNVEYIQEMRQHMQCKRDEKFILKCAEDYYPCINRKTYASVIYDMYTAKRAVEFIYDKIDCKYDKRRVRAFREDIDSHIMNDRHAIHNYEDVPYTRIFQSSISFIIDEYVQMEVSVVDVYGGMNIHVDYWLSNEDVIDWSPLLSHGYNISTVDMINKLSFEIYNSFVTNEESVELLRISMPSDIRDRSSYTIEYDNDYLLKELIDLHIQYHMNVDQITATIIELYETIAKDIGEEGEELNKRMDDVLDILYSRYKLSSYYDSLNKHELRAYSVLKEYLVDKTLPVWATPTLDLFSTT